MRPEDEIKILQQLGSILGWGHMMHLCTALWRRQLATNYGDGCKSGAFIGVCACSIKEDVLPFAMQTVALYDGIVAKALDKEAESYE